MIDATESRIVFRGSKVEVPAGGIASQARTADELNDIMRLMMKAALERMVDAHETAGENFKPINRVRLSPLPAGQ
jgi:hypothetical protein